MYAVVKCMGMRPREWPAESTALLHDLTLSLKDVSDRTGIPLQTVARRRRQLGIQSVKVNHDWTDAEFALLHDRSLSLREVAQLTGRTEGAVRRKADLLGLGAREVTAHTSLPGRAAAFSEDEDRVLRELGDDLSVAELAKLIGRPAHAVGKRLHRLGLRSAGMPTGTGHWNWQGGASQNPAYGWRGEDWRQKRAIVLERDGFTCRDGGEFVPSGRGLVVHHVIPWRLYPTNDPRWLVTLCVSHHMQRPEHQWESIPPAVEDLLRA